MGGERVTGEKLVSALLLFLNPLKESGFMKKISLASGVGNPWILLGVLLRNQIFFLDFNLT